MQTFLVSRLTTRLLLLSACGCAADSRFLLTASSDSTVRLWEVETGAELYKWEFTPLRVKCVLWSEDCSMIAIGCAHFATRPGRVMIFDFPGVDALDEISVEPRVVIENTEPRDNATCMLWRPMNSGLLIAREHGSISLHDPETGEQEYSMLAHEGEVTCLRANRDKTLFITSSADHTCKLWNTRDLVCLHVYNAETRMNGCAISPLMLHVFMAGGQEARDVTTSDTSAGHFETRIHDLVGQEELARIPGHFGTVNTLDINPNGLSFATGGEDGYVRVCFLPPSYFKLGDDPDLHDPAVAAATAAFMEAGADAEEEECWAAAEAAYEAEASKAADAAATAVAASHAGVASSPEDDDDAADE
jgi:translation initiation factor 3 subunit I